MHSVPVKKHDELRHVIRAVRENIGIFKSELDKRGETNRANVAATLGIVETLKLFDIYPGVQTDDLSKWLWLGEDWKEVRVKEDRVYV